MKVLSIISQKGGCSKTTLAVSLAVAAERERKKTAVFDLDPQASASFWKDTRQSASPAVVSCQSSRLGQMLKAAAEQGDLAIIDAPPFAEAELLEPVDQAGHVRHLADDLLADLVAASTVGPRSAKDAEHVVARLGELERPQHAIDLSLEDRRRSHDRDERFLARGRERVPLSKFGGQWREGTGHGSPTIPNFAGEDTERVTGAPGRPDR